MKRLFRFDDTFQELPPRPSKKREPKESDNSYRNRQPYAVSFQKDQSASNTDGKMDIRITEMAMVSLGWKDKDTILFNFSAKKKQICLTKTDVYRKGKTLTIVKASTGRMRHIIVPWTFTGVHPKIRKMTPVINYETENRTEKGNRLFLDISMFF